MKRYHTGTVFYINNFKNRNIQILISVEKNEVKSMKEKIQRFMIGRYGADELSKAQSVVVMILLILSLFGRLGILYWLALALMIYSVWRMFSKNVSKRYEENQKFVNFRYRIVVKWDKMKKRMAQKKTYKFFKCPTCKQEVRVPKGHGKIEITCPKCRERFVKHS